MSGPRGIGFVVDDGDGRFEAFQVLLLDGQPRLLHMSITQGHHSKTTVLCGAMPSGRPPKRMFPSIENANDYLETYVIPKWTAGGKNVAWQVSGDDALGGVPWLYRQEWSMRELLNETPDASMDATAEQKEKEVIDESWKTQPRFGRVKRGT